MNLEKAVENYHTYSQDGFFYRIFLLKYKISLWVKLAIVLGIAWLPLIFICATDGTLINGVQIPFLYDVAMQARLFIALPMLIIIKEFIEANEMNVVKHMSNDLLNPGESQLFITKTFGTTKKLSGSLITEIIMLLIISASTYSLVKSGMYSTLDSGNNSWMATINNNIQSLSIAGYWTVFISIPICQYLLLRWIWKYMVWVYLLYRFSKAGIKLLPTHADNAGGLDIIMIAQRSFCLIFLAMSVILSGQLTATLLDNPAEFNTIRSEVVGYVVICLLLLIIPLTFFSIKLFKIKNDALLRLGDLGTNLSRKFENEWVDKTSVDKVLEQRQIDPSLIYDYNGIYSLLQKLRVLPITIRDILGIGLVLFLPFMPIIFIHFSIGELFQKIAGILI